jgi:hypothetical protein
MDDCADLQCKIRVLRDRIVPMHKKNIAIYQAELAKLEKIKQDLADEERYLAFQTKELREAEEALHELQPDS